RVIGAVVNESTCLMRCHKSCVRQFLQVERRRRVGERKTIDDFASGQSLRPLLHQETEDGETGVLRQRSQGSEYDLCFHNSNYIEMLGAVNHGSRQGLQRFAGRPVRPASFGLTLRYATDGGARSKQLRWAKCAAQRTLSACAKPPSDRELPRVCCG